MEGLFAPQKSPEEEPELTDRAECARIRVFEFPIAPCLVGKTPRKSRKPKPSLVIDMDADRAVPALHAESD